MALLGSQERRKSCFSTCLSRFTSLYRRNGKQDGAIKTRLLLGWPQSLRRWPLSRRGGRLVETGCRASASCAAKLSRQRRSLGFVRSKRSMRFSSFTATAEADVASNRDVRYRG